MADVLPAFMKDAKPVKKDAVLPDFMADAIPVASKSKTPVNEGSSVSRFVKGALRAPMQMEEGLAQLVIRGAEKLGLVSEVDANMAQYKLGGDTKRRDAKAINGTAGNIGNLTGQLVTTAAVPMGRVAKGGKVVSTALTAGRRALAGGGLAAITGAEMTPEEQNRKAVIAAVATPLMVPAMEKIIGVAGAKVGDLYNKITKNAVGKNIYGANGALTGYGRVLRARLRAVNRDLPDELIDDALTGLAGSKATRLPADKDIVATQLAKREKVPLTGAMKTRDSRGIQDFESMQAGSVGGEKGQKEALARSGNIDSAIIENVKSIGSGAKSDVAATNLGKGAKKAYDEAVAHVDRMYEPLNRTMIRDVKKVAEIGSKVRSKFGKGEYATVGGPARGYIDRINAISDSGEPVSFGDLWRLSKDINGDLRKATSNDKHYLGVVKSAVDDYFSDLAKGGSGITKAAAEQLKLANSTNRKFAKTFGDNPVRLRAGGNITDTAGKAVQKVIGHVTDAVERGEAPNPGVIENTIFGAGAALDSAGAKQAVNTIKRITKAAPATKQPIKDITVNRIVKQMEEGLYGKSMKPEKTQTIIKQAVENNRPLLEAAGLSPKDITRLQTNAYLASLKVPAAGARQRGSSATNRGVGRRVAELAFRRALAAALGVGGATAGGPFAGILAYGAAEGALEAAKTVGASRLASKTLSSKVPLLSSPTGRRVGQKIGRAVGAQTARNTGNN